MQKKSNVRILALSALILLLNSCATLEEITEPYIHPKTLHIPIFGTYYKDKTRVVTKRKYIKQVKYIKSEQRKCIRLSRIPNVEVTDVKRYSNRYTLANTRQLFKYVQMCRGLRSQTEIMRGQ